MARAHSFGAVVLLVATVAFVVFALISIRSERARASLDKARSALVALVGLQIVVGLVMLATGDEPGESLHFLYAGLALVALPAASSFAFEAPPKARAGVLGAAGILILAMIWRLWVTGG